MKESPMVRSLRLMRERGYRCYITEHHSRGLTHDLFGFADILCLKDGEVCVVQTTSRPNVSARVRKITESEELPFVRKAGIRILVQGFGFMKRSRTWELMEVDLS